MKRGITVGKNSHSERNNITQRDQDSLGRFLQELPQPMSPEEEVQYVAAAKAGSIHARQMLIAYNARFIVSVAKDFQASTGSTLPLSDLINQGVEGLHKAITVFDPTLGNKLLTYAVWKIRSEMYLFDRKEGRLVRPPTTNIDLSKQIRKHLNRVFVETGNMISEDELAAHVEKSPKAVRKALIFMGSKPKSFDEPLGNDSDASTMHDVFTAPDQVLPDEHVEKREMLTYLRKWVERLPELHKIIIMHSYGIEGTFIMTDQELATALGYTVVRIRQLKKEACKMMLKLSQGKTPKKMNNTKKPDYSQLVAFTAEEESVEQNTPTNQDSAPSDEHEIESTIPPRKSSEIPLAPDTLLNNMLMKYALPTIPKPVLVEFVQAAWEDACAMKDLCEDDVDFMLQAQAMIDAYMKSHVETVQRLLKEYEATFTTKTVGQPGQELDEEMPDMVFTSLAGRTFVKGHSQADAAAKEEALFETLLGNIVPGNTNEYYPD